MLPIASPQAMWTIVKVIHGHQRFRLGFLSLTSCVALRYILWNAYKYWKTQRDTKQRGDKAKDRKRIVKEQCADAEIGDILERDIEDLLRDLKSGALTAEQALRAFQKKALQLDEDFNMITEPIMEALEQAKQLDRTSTKDGLLHGLPISIKENLGITGYDTTGGMACFINQIAKEDAIIVKVLKRHGAVPFVRTNIPQAIMSYCSSNRIYGETSNPHDRSRGPGGSSSGEGSLVGGGGSVMGIGSDVGGSIRVPVAFCGCYGLKPTSHRISYKGGIQVAKGSLPIQSCMGPIAKDLKSLVLLSKVLMSEDMYEMDPQLAYVPFSEEKLNKTGPMRIGYYVFDGNVRCQPAVIRGVMEAKAALEKMGHTMVPVDLTEMSPPGFQSGQWFARFIMADRFHLLRRLLKYERYEKAMTVISNSLFLLPPWAMKMLGILVSFKDKYASQIIGAGVGFKSIPEYQEHILKFRTWQDKFMDSWLDMKLDSIICPVFPSVAPKKDMLHKLTMAGVYVSLYNSLDYPSGVLPVTKVTKEDVKNTMDPSVHKPSLIIEKLMMKSVEGSEGMPVGVQCVALPYREETCLRVMREVEAGLKG